MASADVSYRLYVVPARQIRDGRTTVDLVFTSSSTTATYMASSNRSGNATWRTSDGTRLKDLV